MSTARDDMIANIAGPEEMAMPGDPAAENTEPGSSGPAAKKKKRHRAGRKKQNRESFQSGDAGEDHLRPGLLDNSQRSGQSSSFYRRQRHSSNTSLESEALLDHRDHGFTRHRHNSHSQGNAFTRPSLPFTRHRGSTTSGPMAAYQRSRVIIAPGTAVAEDEEESNDRTPLLSQSRNQSLPELRRVESGSRQENTRRDRKHSANSKASSKKRAQGAGGHSYQENDEFDVNNPPSVPASPRLGSLDSLMSNSERGRDAVITIDSSARNDEASPEALRRRGTIADLVERDVCFPGDTSLSEAADEDRHSVTSSRRERGKRRTAQWPDLEILEDWHREEKEERTHQEYVRAKKINEPVMVGGRLRPGRTVWHREEEEEPFRFTYFNETFDGTIHARTISDLVQEGTTFKDLFLPEPVELGSDCEEDEDDSTRQRLTKPNGPSGNTLNGRFRGVQHPKDSSDGEELRSVSLSHSQTLSPAAVSRQTSASNTPQPQTKEKRFGPRPTFWLDVLQPTEVEMKVLAKAFGIHQLTTEDILMGEEREKVELFPNYYFVNYRSFEQDKDSEDHMDPINFYAVVFRDGVITFHHKMTPHPANVRRRIRQLNDYMSPTADWISYAIIDDITDVYTPRVAQIESDVDAIDEEILYMNQTSADKAERAISSGKSEAGGDPTMGQLGGDMLRRVGESRKRVQSLYRLLGNKADVIKGFAKRCNEHWEVAPRSEIGLYLGDIQDHIVTMSSNLGHYES